MARRGPVLWGSVAVAVVALLAMGSFAYLHRDRMAGGIAEQSLVQVGRGTVTVSAAAAGTVEATDTRGLSFTVSGTVTTIAVQPGDMVTAGKVLARIDDTDQRDAVSSAQSSVTNAENTLSQAKSTASATAGTSTSGCQVAAAYRTSASPTSTPSPTASPTGSPTSTASPPASTVPSAPPRSSAIASQPAPGGTMPTTPGAGPTGGTGTCAGTQAGSGARAGSGTDSVYSAEQSLNNAQLQLEQAESNLAGTVITAPIDGRVLSVNGTAGTSESPGSSAFITIGDVSDTQVQAEFSEADVASLAVGQKATITLGSRTETLSGKVSQISPSGTSSGQLVQYSVMIAFDDPPADLLYGQSANVVVTTGSAANVLYVASTAVTIGPGSTATVTVSAHGRTEQRSVRIGLSGDQYTEIRSGLSEGDKVVVSGGG